MSRSSASRSNSGSTDCKSDTMDAPCLGAHDQGNLSRACTLDAALNLCDASAHNPDEVVHNWSLRPTSFNDAFLRGSFNHLLAESATLPPDQRLIMYDACDEHEVRAPLGVFRKRLDARRNTKPKKPDAQKLVCTPFDPNGFNFSKIKNPRERILKVALKSGRYDLLSNKFPLYPKHMLLVADALVAQQMTMGHLSAITELLASTSFCAYFNSWCASASVNHFHCHLIDEMPPVTAFPLVAGPMVDGTRCLQPDGFPGFCYVYEHCQLERVGVLISAMQEENQPHNLLFTPRHVYVFPKPLERPERSFELYPETVGGPELIGSFTVYRQEDYDRLAEAHVNELCRINTAPLPSKLLQRGGGAGVDDAAVHQSVAQHAAGQIPSSRSLNYIPRTMRVAGLPIAAA